MKILRIELKNFGSYADNCIFNLQSDEAGKRIVVIGGKNGAGKTTLFTAMQVCLYGHSAFGYKTFGKFYQKLIYNLINNEAKLNESESAYCKLVFSHIDGNEEVLYTVCRSWSWKASTIREQLTVEKNGMTLANDSLANFQKYLLHLIPPDMLRLYFFDGEKIADYFLGSKELNIRDALMVLSGNDTFDIIYDNVKRLLGNTAGSSEIAAREYIQAKNRADTLSKRIMDLSAQIQSLENDLESLRIEIRDEKESYTRSGGVSIDEWKVLHAELKGEEDRRERLNWEKKEFATNILPFIIMKKLVREVWQQVEEENKYNAYNVMKAQIGDAAFYDMLRAMTQDLGFSAPKKTAEEIYGYIANYFLDESWESFAPLLELSADEEHQVRALVKRTEDASEKTLYRLQKRIASSLQRSKELRTRIQTCDIENYAEYSKIIVHLTEQMNAINGRLLQKQDQLVHIQEEYEQAKAEMKKAREKFEAQLKQKSMATLTSRLLLLLEDLQRVVYTKLIDEVETDLRSKLEQLMRKHDFFSDIIIDSDFTVHIIRDTTINTTDLVSILNAGGVDYLRSALGSTATAAIACELDCEMDTKELLALLKEGRKTAYILPVEVNKDQLSSGEKQVFVMALYWALMHQSKNNLPFIIDTPFARIDTEHRDNITNYFFNDLPGQLFVLSTNEEISGRHLARLNDQIARVYTLEYGDDKRTRIFENEYFEV